MIFRIDLAMYRGRIWDSTHLRSLSVSSIRLLSSVLFRWFLNSRMLGERVPGQLSAMNMELLPRGVLRKETAKLLKRACASARPPVSS
jgi:hypothetical protein